METMLIREFRADHQRITGSLLRLTQAILQVDVPQGRKILGGTDTLLGGHFLFEELHVYPALVGFIGMSGVRQLLHEHDDIFRGVGELMALTSRASWSDADRDAAIHSFGLVGDHPKNRDNLCRYVEQLPASQQDALLGRMQVIRLERLDFSDYAIAR